MRNRRDNINNETAYFRKVLKNMNFKQKLKDATIDNNESLFDEIENVCTCEDKYFCESSLLDWIEMIENADLHTAIKSLSLEEQTLLSYIFYKEKTQSEVAEIYNVTRPAITKNISKILNKMKRLLFDK